MKSLRATSTKSGGAYKHVLAASHRTGSIFSGGGEVKVDAQGSVFEAFATLSQALPLITDGFLHAHAGVEVPAGDESASKEAFWRVAIGKSFMEHIWGRAWSPMVEILAARPLETGAAAEWDVVPQLQVSLSTRQHVLLNVGVRVPVTQRSTRQTSCARLPPLGLVRRRIPFGLVMRILIPVLWRCCHCCRCICAGQRRETAFQDLRSVHGLS